MAILRAREICSGKSRKISVVEAVHSRSGETSAGLFHHWSLEPAAIIVSEEAETFALDMKGRRVGLAELERRFPKFKLRP